MRKSCKKQIIFKNFKNDILINNTAMEIHENCPRKEFLVTSTNYPSTHKNILESELFGYEPVEEEVVQA
jgi:transcriptional regulator of acetoin/glycerol metabolism